MNEMMDTWADTDAYVIQAPVATGKSYLAVGITRWAESFDLTSAIVPPNEQLQRQYEDEFGELASVWAKRFYRCSTYRTNCEKGGRKCKGGVCKGCPYQQAIRVAQQRAQRLLNPYTLLAQRKTLRYPETLVFDEAHKLLDFQSEQLGVKLWRNKHHFPLDLETTEDVLRWIEHAQRNDPHPERARARKLLHDLKAHAFVEKVNTYYRGKPDVLLHVKPLTTRHLRKPILWPRSVKKLILMSASIGEKDVHELGIDLGRRVKYLTCDSPIPPQNRPIVVIPVERNVFVNKETVIPKMAERIIALADHHAGQSGLVHVTYGDAERLKPYLLQDLRFMWHDHDTKQDTFKQWRDGERGRILVGSGFTEGINLVGDLARWQVITRVPFPSKADAAVRLKAEQDPEWYCWQAVKDLLQMVGRVCRTPDDFGVTYILDELFPSLYDERNYLFPAWFTEAVRR